MLQVIKHKYFDTELSFICVAVVFDTVKKEVKTIAQWEALVKHNRFIPSHMSFEDRYESFSQACKIVEEYLAGRRNSMNKRLIYDGPFNVVGYTWD